ncbi:MAG: MMPL family transporter [Arachnia sp.]
MTAPSKPLRISIAVLLIVLWFAGGAIGGPYFGKIDEVSDNDQASYLPASAEATKVSERLPEFVGDEAIPAIAIFSSDQDLDAQTLTRLTTLASNLASVDGVVGASPLIPAEDGKAAQTFISIEAEADVSDVVNELRDTLDQTSPEGLTYHVTGPAGLSADLSGAFAGIDGLLLAVALAAVLVILLIVYRSILLPIVVLSTSIFALTVALLVNWWLAKAGILTLTGQTQGILFILVIGAATDYSLLYTARFAEELRRHPKPWQATKASIAGSLEPILASGGTVIVGLLTLLLSDLSSNKSLGPVAAIGIAFAMLAALTLLPSMLYLLGRAAYWPRRPSYDPSRNDEVQTHTGIYARVGRLVSKHPRRIWIGCVVVLALGAAFVPTLKADGVPASDFVLGVSDARDGQELLAKHFPGGSGSPASVLVAEADLQQVADTLLASDGVASVSVLSEESPAGSAQVTNDGIQPLGPPGTPAPAPTVSHGDVLLQATLSDAADSDAAEVVIRELRDELGSTALIGGTTAVAVDTNDASIHDRNTIIPIVLVVIFVILMLLLRSLVAPLLLIATTVLSFGTAMGTAAIVFNHILDFPGADPSVPLYGFVFLVALGIDYNIFLMTRVREESLTHGTRPGIHRGLAVTGGVITSAGLVLAATFAALAVLPILFLVQLAFIVSFGVLLDTFLVRTLFVPAAAYDIGAKLWWPKRLEADVGRHVDPEDAPAHEGPHP